MIAVLGILAVLGTLLSLILLIVAMIKKTDNKKKFVISLIICFCVFLFAVSAPDDPAPNRTGQSDSVVPVVALCAIPVSIVIAVYVGKRFFPKNEKGDGSTDRNQEEVSANQIPQEKTAGNSIPSFSIDWRAKLQLVGGLEGLPQGSICKARYNRERIIFSASGQEFTLDASKMIDVSVMTPKEIQTQYVSSIGGAVAGALLLGPLGAIIGGSASKKKITNKKKYLIFTYISGDETKYIVFDVTTRPADGSNIKATYQFLKRNKKIKVDL